MEASARPHRRLIWKYTAVVVTLVAAAIVSVGLTELYFAYQDSKTGCDACGAGQGGRRGHCDRAADAGVPAGLDGVAQPAWRQERQAWRANQEFRRVIERDESSAGSRTWTRPGGSGVRISRLEIDRIGRGADFSRAATFVRARADQRYLGRVYFVGGSRPYMRIAVAETRPGRGVVVAEIDLSSVRARDRPSAHRDVGIRVRRRFTRRVRRPQGHRPRPPAHELRVAAAGARPRSVTPRTAPPMQRRSAAIRTGRRSSAPSRPSIRRTGASSSRSR